MSLWSIFELDELYELRQNKQEAINTLEQIRMTSINDILRIRKHKKELAGIVDAIQVKESGAKNCDPIQFRLPKINE